MIITNKNSRLVLEYTLNVVWWRQIIIKNNANQQNTSQICQIRHLQYRHFPRSHTRYSFIWSLYRLQSLKRENLLSVSHCGSSVCLLFFQHLIILVHVHVSRLPRNGTVQLLPQKGTTRYSMTDPAFSRWHRPALNIYTLNCTNIGKTQPQTSCTCMWTQGQKTFKCMLLQSVYVTAVCSWVVQTTHGRCVEGWWFGQTFHFFPSGLSFFTVSPTMFHRLPLNLKLVPCLKMELKHFNAVHACNIVLVIHVCGENWCANVLHPV